MSYQTAFDSFWSSFYQVCCHQHGFSILPRSSPFKVTFDTEDDSILRMSTETALHLVEWPYKHQSTKKVHILVDSEESFQSNGYIVDSEVNVTYFELKAGTKIPLHKESIRYDFESDVKPGHPIFHAQLRCRPDIRSLPQSCSDYNFSQIAPIERHEHLRIPSANMNTVSVLVTLVADHTNAIVLKELIEKTQNIPGLPRVNARVLFNRVSPHKDFRSFHWYLKF